MQTCALIALSYRLNSRRSVQVAWGLTFTISIACRIGWFRSRIPATFQQHSGYVWVL